MGGSDSMVTPKIILEGMTKSFGDKQVLRGIDLEVAPEESLAIIGTSGCGWGMRTGMSFSRGFNVVWPQSMRLS